MMCGRKCSHKELPNNFSGNFGEIQAKIFRTPKICLLHLCVRVRYKRFAVHSNLTIILREIDSGNRVPLRSAPQTESNCANVDTSTRFVTMETSGAKHHVHTCS